MSARSLTSIRSRIKTKPGSYLRTVTRYERLMLPPRTYTGCPGTRRTFPLLDFRANRREAAVPRRPIETPWKFPREKPTCHRIKLTPRACELSSLIILLSRFCDCERHGFLSLEETRNACNIQAHGATRPEMVRPSSFVISA